MEKYEYYDDIFVAKNFGFNNIGAICWCNSVLQLFLSLPSMNKVLLATRDCAQNDFSREYINVIKCAVTGKLDLIEQKSLVILENFQKRARETKNYIHLTQSQECVDEAFMLFIDMFNLQRLNDLFKVVYKISTTCNSCQKDSSIMRDNSLRIILNSHIELTDEQIFRNYILGHPVEHEYYRCDCGFTTMKPNRKEKLVQLSEILVITFDKFHTKKYRWFPQSLTFPAISGPNFLYKLVAKIEHIGNMNGGHYYAHVLRNGVWVRFDDNNISPGNNEPTAETFMVAYHMVKNS